MMSAMGIFYFSSAATERNSTTLDFSLETAEPNSNLFDG